MSSAHIPTNPSIKPTAIVAGGAGFIGSHLCEKLLANHVEVVCVDNFSSGKKSHLVNCLNSPDFHLLELDAESLSLNRILRAHYIFDVIDTEDHPFSPQANLNALLEGTTTTRRLIDIAKKHSAKFLLVSTLDIYSAFISETSLAQYFGSSLSSNQALAESKRVAEAITAEYYRLHHLNARVVRLTDVYGPRMEINSNQPLSRLISQAVSNLPLQVTSGYSRHFSPVYVTDAIEGIMKAMFSPGTNGEIFTLSSPELISESTLASLLHSISSSPIIPIPPSSSTMLPPIAAIKSNLPWKPSVSPEAGFKKTLAWFASNPQPHHLESSTPTTPPKNLRLQPLRTPTLKPQKPILVGRFALIILSVIICLLIIISPVIALAGTTAIALSHLQKVLPMVQAGQLESSLQQAQSANKYFSLAQQELAYIGAFTAKIGLSAATYRLEKLLDLGKNISESSLHIITASTQLSASSRVILGQETGDPLTPLIQAQAEVTRAYELLSLATADVAASRPNLKKVNLGSIGASYSKLENLLPQLQQKVASTRNTLSVVPALIGAPGEKKTYLLLLQNNAELRPTGGFVGSFALITFENGKLLDFLVEDVYTADGQLKGHVEPPAPIKKYLGEGGWYLRDVNWDPDFPTTARQAEWFLQKELDKEVDGTLAINLHVAKHLLEAIGPVTIPDYSETITSQNLFERAEYHSEINFFPGSTQKKDFLGSLARTIYSKMQSLSTGEFLSLARAFDQSLAERQLLISPKNESLSAVFVENNWAGDIISPACNPAPCLADYWNLVEANVGVNKANYFVNRQILHQLTILKENHLRATTKVTYTNTSAAQSWPAGDYKNYLRLYVPLGSELESVTIGDQKLSQSAVEITREHNKTVFAFLTTVPIKATSNVTITYTLPGKLTFETGNPLASYTGLFQKQSGVGKDPLTIEIAYPAYMKPITTPPGSIVGDQTITINTTTLEDTTLNLQFVK